MSKPLVIELFAGTFGWGAGFIAEGYDVVGFDIVDVESELGVPRTPSCQLVLQDVLTLHGSQFRSATCIVASPPCQEYSYMAMPWSRGKKIAAEYRDRAREVKQLTALFDACFRIQREACEAVARYIPLVVENVRGAETWVGPARWHYGSFYLWGDVPALMPKARVDAGTKHGGDCFNDPLWRGPQAGSKSNARKAASAQIAKIPLPLARWVARCFK